MNYRKFLFSSSVYALGQVLNRSAVIILLPLYTTYLPTEEYGVLSLLNITSSLLTTVLPLGLVSSLFRFSFQKEGRIDHDLISTVSYFLFIVETIMLFVLQLFADKLTLLVFSDLAYLTQMRIMLVSLYLQLLLLLPYAFVRIKEQPLYFVSVSFASVVINISTASLLIIKYDLGVTGVLVANVVSGSFGICAFLPAVFKTILPRFDRALLKKALSFGLPLVPANLAAFVLYSSASYFLRHFQGLSDVGLYNLAFRFSSTYNFIIMSPFFLAWTPTMYKLAKGPDPKRRYIQVFEAFMLISITFYFLVCIAAKAVLPVLAGNVEYHTAYYPLPLLLSAAVFYGVYMFHLLAFMLTDHTGKTPFISVTSAGVSLLLNYLLIPVWGIYGAAAAVFFAYLNMALISYFWGQRLFPINYRWMKLLLLYLLVTGLVLLYYFLIPLYNLPLLFGSALFLVILVGGVIWRWYGSRFREVYRLIRPAEK
ncbi:oligosaccharide flippase family protein [bacterium]|nr:oligosaccharide flippase family protein [bacterium]